MVRQMVRHTRHAAPDGAAHKALTVCNTISMSMGLERMRMHMCVVEADALACTCVRMECIDSYAFMRMYASACTCVQ